MPSEIGVQEMPTWAQDPRHFGEEPVEVWIGMGGLDVDDGVEGLVGKGQVFGVSMDEFQPR